MASVAQLNEESVYAILCNGVMCIKHSMCLLSPLSHNWYKWRRYDETMMKAYHHSVMAGEALFSDDTELFWWLHYLTWWSRYWWNDQVCVILSDDWSITLSMKVINNRSSMSAWSVSEILRKLISNDLFNGLNEAINLKHLAEAGLRLSGNACQLLMREMRNMAVIWPSIKAEMTKKTTAVCQLLVSIPVCAKSSLSLND